jgi:hypothetical protein
MAPAVLGALIGNSGRISERYYVHLDDARRRELEEIAMRVRSGT